MKSPINYFKAVASWEKKSLKSQRIGIYFYSSKDCSEPTQKPGWLEQWSFVHCYLWHWQKKDTEIQVEKQKEKPGQEKLGTVESRKALKQMKDSKSCLKDHGGVKEKTNVGWFCPSACKNLYYFVKELNSIKNTWSIPFIITFLKWSNCKALLLH